MNEFKLMAIGDVHLGTRPGNLPDALADVGVDVQALTPAAALDAAVERAIDEGVCAVLFAGDVVESTNARYEALRPLEQAVRRLLAANIEVLGVAGNHDVEALPRLAGLFEGFRLIGAGGRWESYVLHVLGAPAVEIVGWSFPAAQVRYSPVAALLQNPLPRAPSRGALVPRIGLLHGDLDASAGPYAPIRSQELRDAGLDAWLLGHIHKPSLGQGRAAGVPCGYLGSLVGLDVNETGLHGPWLITLNDAGAVLPHQIALAPLRWETISVEVAAAESANDLGDRLFVESERVAREVQASGHFPRVLGLRVRLVGATQHYDAIEKCVHDGSWHDHLRNVGNTVVFIQRVYNHLTLAVDLELLAAADDPPALLARQLLALQKPGAARQRLLAEARDALRETAEDQAWSALGTQRDAHSPLEDEALQRVLEQAGMAALHALLAQGASNEQGFHEMPRVAALAANVPIAEPVA